MAKHIAIQHTILKSKCVQMLLESQTPCKEVIFILGKLFIQSTRSSFSAEKSTNSSRTLAMESDLRCSLNSELLPTVTKQL